MNAKRVAALCLIVSISFTAGAFAASNIEKVEAFLRRDYQVFLDGKKVDVGPVLVYKGSSYLPLSKMGRLLNADVNWRNENKGIYVISRFQGQPAQPEKNLDYDEITLGSPWGYTATYLGGEYPVLVNMALEGKTYYRDSDIQRMGIDTRGLRKTYEKLTDELYITEDEISKVWKEKVIFTPSYKTIVTGENNPEKIKVITDFIEYFPEMMKFLNRDNPNYIYYIPQFFAIDALPDNEYFLLSNNAEGKFVRIRMKLVQTKDGKWMYSQYSSTNLD